MAALDSSINSGRKGRRREKFMVVIYIVYKIMHRINMIFTHFE